MTTDQGNAKRDGDMCNCLTWCRVPTENNGWKYPMSLHHPNCEDFIPEQFTRLEFDGVVCVMERQEADAMLDDSEEQYTVSTVMLTRDQFEQMPEFSGF